MSSYPVPDRPAAAALGDALRRVGYSEERVSDLVGEDAYPGEQDEVPVSERRLPQTHFANVVRLLFLQLPLPAAEAIGALGDQAIEALATTGLADVGDDVVPRGRILPVGSLLVASDDYPSHDGENPPDYVVAFSPTSQLLASLTPRRRVARALDVGTGSGVQALFAARHARHVVATDVNPRALAFTELNAALNGLGNIECRPGSLFEPAADEEFDLITCNAPYVVSPENRWVYRDAGLQADEVSERVVRGAAEHLAADGFATTLVSWIARDENNPDEHPLAWTSGIECDSWIIPIWGADSLGHAATWNDELAEDREKFAGALDRWTDYLAELGVQWVSEGAVLLHRRPGHRHTARVDEVDEEDLEDAGEQIERAFAARARLAELQRTADLLDRPISLAAPVLLEHELAPRHGRTSVLTASLQLAEGTQTQVEASPRALEIVAALDGSAPLGERIGAAAQRLGLSEADEARLRREVVRVARELLELGALRFA
jgi:methylase of polypeptide subunit release factors